MSRRSGPGTSQPLAEGLAGDRGRPTRSGARPEREGPPSHWRVILSDASPGPENMALDHALALQRRRGEGVLRLYGWSRPTVSFGRNEPARGLYDPEAADREGVGFVRRPTGGRVVLHDDELTYAVAAPIRGWGGLRDAYRAINRGLVRGLRLLGVEATLADAPDGREAPLSAGPCFQLPAEGEVAAGSRKLVGSAQARVEHSLLQHGSLLLSGSQDALARIGPEATAEAGAPPTTLRSLLGDVPPRAQLVEGLVQGLCDVLEGRWRWVEGPADEEREAARSLLSRYGSPEWTWRR